MPRTNSQDRQRKPRRNLRSIDERLDYYADTSGGPDACWLWQGATKPNGYGSMRVGGAEVDYAHRRAWIRKFGRIPAGLFVCHNCPGGDNPSCVNPNHLFLGTHQDNMDDMLAKGRHRSGDQRGMANGRAKLTDAQVRDIREWAANGATGASLARQFGLGATTIKQIIRRERWCHVD